MERGREVGEEESQTTAQFQERFGQAIESTRAKVTHCRSCVSYQMALPRYPWCAQSEHSTPGVAHGKRGFSESMFTEPEERSPGLPEQER